MGWLLFILILLILIACCSSSSDKTKKKPTKIELINSYLPQTIVTTINPEPNFYCINIPLKVHNLYKHPSNGSERIHFDFIYFRLSNGEFSTGETVISYDLNELHTIFKNAIQNNESNIYINLTLRKLAIFPEDNHNIRNSTILRNLHKELKNVDQRLESLNKEIARVESLLNVIELSNLYQYQSETYQRGLRLLQKSQIKANKIRDGYLKILREYLLSFYLVDVEPSVFQVENNEIVSEAKYDLFKEDYHDFLQSMKEYRELKLESLS